MSPKNLAVVVESSGRVEKKRGPGTSAGAGECIQLEDFSDRFEHTNVVIGIPWIPSCVRYEERVYAQWRQ